LPGALLPIHQTINRDFFSTTTSTLSRRSRRVNQPLTIRRVEPARISDNHETLDRLKGSLLAVEEKAIARKKYTAKKSSRPAKSKSKNNGDDGGAISKVEDGAVGDGEGRTTSTGVGPYAAEGKKSKPVKRPKAPSLPMDENTLASDADTASIIAISVAKGQSTAGRLERQRNPKLLKNSKPLQKGPVARNSVLRSMKIRNVQSKVKARFVSSTKGALNSLKPGRKKAALPKEGTDITKVERKIKSNAKHSGKKLRIKKINSGPDIDARQVSAAEQARTESPAKLRETRANTNSKTPRKPRSSPAHSEPYSLSPTKTSVMKISDLDPHASREVLVQAIERNSLSPNDTVEAVRRLRANLAKGMSSRAPVPKKDPAEKSSTNNSLLTGSTKKAATKKATAKKDLVKRTPSAGKEMRSLEKPAATYVDSAQDAETTSYKPANFKGKGFEVISVSADELELTPIEKIQEKVPTLSYGLERVLFNPGVYHLQDPRSRVINFDPYLQKIMPVDEFDFNALKEYITSSRDATLLRYTKEEKKKYTGSTSSMTSALAHFHFLLSHWRPINPGILSKDFPVEYQSFTKLQRGPTAVFLRYKDGVYAIDADKQYDTSSILSMLGKSMEKLLTLPTEEYEKYRKTNSHKLSDKERKEPETFHYTTMGDFLLRSQLDAHDPRLPGTGTFDIKTRAVVSIRMDTKSYEEGMDYEIKGLHGDYESYEREYYDMIRAAFLKYSLQVRMGRMDGIFVAFHNTRRIFGFQYISLPEMDYALHGSRDTTTGDAEFKLSLNLLNKALDQATERYPKKSLRIHFETRETGTPFMYFFAEPIEDEQIDMIQESNRADEIEFQKRVLGMVGKSDEELLVEKKNAEWEKIRSQVEESIGNEELDIQARRAVAEHLLEESEHWDELSPAEKESCIEALLSSAAFNEGTEDDSQRTAFVDQAIEEDGEVEEYGLIDENNINDDDDDENVIDADNLDDEDEEGEEQEKGGDEEEYAAEVEIEMEENEFRADEAEETLANDEVEIPEYCDTPEIVDEILHDSNGNEMCEGLVEDSDIGEYDTQLSESIEDPAMEDSRETTDDVLEDQDSQQVEDSSKVIPDDLKCVSDDTEFSDSTNEDSESQQGEDSIQIVSHTQNTEGKAEPGSILAMTLTIRNKVNGKYIPRPDKLQAGQNWTVEYALAEITDQDRARTLYAACKKRRWAVIVKSPEKFANNSWNNVYMDHLHKLSKKGKAFREKQDAKEALDGQKVLNGVILHKE
jgi:hypothetical protein